MASGIEGIWQHCAVRTSGLLPFLLHFFWDNISDVAVMSCNLG